VPSIERRGPTTWRLVVSLGYDESGRQVKRTRTVHGGRREAERELARFQVEMEQQACRRTDDLSLAAWSARWLDDVRHRLSCGTVAGYRQHLRDRIVPALGTMPLQQLTSADVHHWLRRTQRAGRVDGKGPITEATLLRVFRTLSGCLQEAVYRGLIDINPCRNVRPPAPKRPAIRFYGPNEARRLLSALDTERLTSLRLLCRLALATGARRNELLALDWSAIGWSDQYLNITCAITREEGMYRLKRPKSGVARRVALDAATIALLRHWETEQAVARALSQHWAAGDRIFTTTAGRWLTPYFVSQWFARFVRRHELPPLTFHGLRHTAASLMLGHGISTVAAAQVLGHSSPSVTTNVYGHVLAGAMRQASDVLARQLDAPDEQSPT